MDLKEIGYEDMHWIHLVQSYVSFRVCTNSHNSGFQQKNIYIPTNFYLQQTDQKISNSSSFYTFFPYCPPTPRIINLIFYIFGMEVWVSCWTFLSIYLFFQILVWYINTAWQLSHYAIHRFVGTSWNSLLYYNT
jgi:hypothetical protein